MGTNVDEPICLPKFEQLLQKSLGKDVELINYEARKFLPFGENYCSLMVKIEATIRRGKCSDEEKLQLVAKTAGDFEKYPLIWPKVFKKEVFIYQHLVPMYREIELALGVNADDVFNNVPKFYGYRDSLHDTDDEKVDKDSMMLMENLKARGYYTVDRKKGLDAHHARKALAALARFHALGIATKHLQPDFIESAVMPHARITGIYSEQIDLLLVGTLKLVRDLPFFAKHRTIIESRFEYCKGSKPYLARPSEPWATVVHGDFWSNNILFHKDEISGQVDDVKFYDFQVHLYQSPLWDLTYFLLSNLDEATSAERLDELIDDYYESFIEALKKLKCDVTAFGRPEFEAELKKQALSQFPICLMLIRIIISEAAENAEDKRALDTVFGGGHSSRYVEKIAKVVAVYERKGWF